VSIGIGNVNLPAQPFQRASFVDSNRGDYSDRDDALAVSRRVGWKALMRKPVDIDGNTSRAIVREIGETLRASFKEDQELPANVRMQLERLRQSEGEAQPNTVRSKPR